MNIRILKSAFAGLVLSVSSLANAGLMNVSTIEIESAASSWLQVSELVAWNNTLDSDLALSSAGAMATASDFYLNNYFNTNITSFLPRIINFFTPLIYSLSLIAIVFISLVALMQDDMKKLIAYSSVAHMGFVTLGIFTLTQQGIEGSIIQMISHGLVSAALFLCVGVLYDRTHSRLISTYGGIVSIMPKYAVVLMIFTLAAIGLPGTSGFIGEFLILT